jgi:hypothetical protein
MKKLMTCTIVLAMLIPLSGLAQPSNHVKLGINYLSFRTERGKNEPALTAGPSGQNSFGIKGGASLSSFRNEERKMGEGLVLGLWQEWRLAKRIALVGELLFVRKRTVLENKSVLPEYPLWQFPPYSDSVYYYNIDCSFDLVEIPLLVRYAVPLGRSFELQLIGGPSLALGFKDRSRLEFLYSVPAPGGGGAPLSRVQHEYDYAHSGNDKGVMPTASGFNFNVGIGLKKSFASFECRYTMDLHETDKAGHVQIIRKFQTASFLLSLRI